MYIGVCLVGPGVVTALTLTPNGTTVNMEWQPEGSPCISKLYRISYELTNRDQCHQQRPSSIEDVGSFVTTSYSLDLEYYYYSTYRVYVTVVLNGSHSGDSATRTITTGQLGKSSCCWVWVFLMHEL